MHVLSTESVYALIENAPDGVFIHDVRGRILGVNARTCLDLGYARGELLTMTIDDISCGAAPAENASKWSDAPPA